MARVWSALCMIMMASGPWEMSGAQQAVQHRHLRRQAVVGLALHHAARAVEHRGGDRGVAPYRQAVHDPALGRGSEPVLAHAPVGEGTAQARIRGGVAIAGGGTPLLYIEDLG